MPLVDIVHCVARASRFGHALLQRTAYAQSTYGYFGTRYQPLRDARHRYIGKRRFLAQNVSFGLTNHLWGKADMAREDRFGSDRPQSGPRAQLHGHLRAFPVRSETSLTRPAAE